MAKPLNQQVVVITGASSGIGRATAIELGHHGATVVLAARNVDALNEAAREVQQAGGKTHVIRADVGHWDQVEKLARATVERFGRIDTWINNAAIIEYATLDQTTPDEMDQIIRVNLLGQMYGSKAALAHMRNQNSGHIINVGSIESWFAAPYHTIYAASKHGVKGLTEALRRELMLQGSPIEVTLIAPSGINTPLFDHARSKLGVKPMPIPPAYPPETVAEAIAHVCEHPLREVVVGGAGKLFTVLERICPTMLDMMLSTRLMGDQGQRSSQPDHPEDNLFAPATTPYKVEGSHHGITRSTSLYTRYVELHPLVKTALTGAGLLGAFLLLRSLTGGGSTKTTSQDAMSAPSTSTMSRRTRAAAEVAGS